MDREKKPAPRLTPAELEALKEQLLKNLADPSVPDQVEEAQRRREEELQRAVAHVGAKKD